MTVHIPPALILFTVLFGVYWAIRLFRGPDAAGATLLWMVVAGITGCVFAGLGTVIYLAVLTLGDL